jgi:hypothetical protein
MSKLVTNKPATLTPVKWKDMQLGALYCVVSKKASGPPRWMYYLHPPGASRGYLFDGRLLYEEEVKGAWQID